jgi:hypothetical protein
MAGPAPTAGTARKRPSEHNKFLTDLLTSRKPAGRAAISSPLDRSGNVVSSPLDRSSKVASSPLERRGPR